MNEGGEVEVSRSQLPVVWWASGGRSGGCGGVGVGRCDCDRAAVQKARTRNARSSDADVVWWWGGVDAN